MEIIIPRTEPRPKYSFIEVRDDQLVLVPPATTAATAPPLLPIPIETLLANDFAIAATLGTISLLPRTVDSQRSAPAPPDHPTPQ